MAEQQGAQARRKKAPPTAASALSGAIAGSLISACVQPLDVIRTKMQGDAARGLHRTTLQAAAEIVKAGGIRGLWQGTGPSVLRVGAGAGVHFVLLEQVKAMLLAAPASGPVETLTAAGAALAGGLSRAAAAVLLCPITVVKTRMEYATDDVSVPRYRNTAHALASIARQEGPRGLFRGVLPTVLTNAPFSGLYYMFYTQLKERMSGEGRPQTLVNFGCGVAAAVAATLLTQPADVVRTRMQLGLGVAGAKPLGPYGTLVQVLKQQGPSALLIGVAPRVLKRTCQTALVWTLYEELLPRLTAVYAVAMAAASKTAVSSDANTADGSSASGKG